MGVWYYEWANLDIQLQEFGLNCVRFNVFSAWFSTFATHCIDMKCTLFSKLNHGTWDGVDWSNSKQITEQLKAVFAIICNDKLTSLLLELEPLLYIILFILCYLIGLF